MIRGGLTAEAAVQRVASELHDRMRRISDAYLRERLADMEDLANRLLTALTGEVPRAPVPEGAILLARRLGPAELLDWHARGIAGVAVEEASPSGHAAILARALGIPALGGLRGMLDSAEQGDEAVVDADEGQFILRPEAEVQRAYLRAQEARNAKYAELATWRGRPAVTADGVALKLMLNIGLSMELPQLERTGADGIGLFRTEIAMLARGSVADVAEQAAIYARVMDEAGGKPVMFRTLDLGADKLLPGTVSTEENPAMGWRSLRVGLDRPALLRRQLRALLLAAGGRDLSVMFPMVATVAEFHAAKGLLMAEAKRVRPCPGTLQYRHDAGGAGADVAVAGTAARRPTSSRLARMIYCSFCSLPTAERRRYTNATISFPPLCSTSWNNWWLRQHAAGVPVSLCGEAALPAAGGAGAGGPWNYQLVNAGKCASCRSRRCSSQVDLGAFRAVLAAIRRGGGMGLRASVATWAREQGILT